MSRFLAAVLAAGDNSGEECIEACPRELEPVCGSDGVIYSSVCHMKKENCKKDVYVLPDEHCARSRGSTCTHSCVNVQDPVCGSDGRTYLNLCMLRVETCRSGIEFAHFGVCAQDDNDAEKNDCPADCSSAPQRRPHLRL
ncbi:hypothetical protein O3P69_007658 [Scylla paramamosain]|uniref:Kazal-like domain-containing protein n=1 Tax=Scylla paramamosain TaxID=85552 RepID=A0AAW0UWP1_SCYPA